jgi:hypothetical protein
MQTVEGRETLGRSIWSALELQQSELNSSDIDGLWQVTLLDGDQRDGFLARLMQRFDEFAHGWAGFA